MLLYRFAQVYSVTFRYLILSAFLVCMGAGNRCLADKLPMVTNVELQPLAAQAERVVQSLELLGAPLNQQQLAALELAVSQEEPGAAVLAIQKVLDPLCLIGVKINPESRVKSYPGEAPKLLMEQGWRVFLVKVHNAGGVTAPLRCLSPHAAPVGESDGDPEPEQTITRAKAAQRWLDVSMYNKQPLAARLSGLELEYRIIELYSRDAGKREAKLQFDVGQGTQDLGFRSESNILFDCEPSVDLQLEVLDHDRSPTVGQFTIRDHRGRVYPARARRVAPDFFFHDQIYRADGESVRLPPGTYTFDYSRGPEYQIVQREVVVPEGKKHTERFQLKRWINMAQRGWFSGDHHVHAAGCAHYSTPAQGVNPEDMMLHILGEDLNVGCVLTWGPCWYHQKQFFQGRINDLSTGNNLMRYDVEVSGFPSSHAGHLVLLRLAEDDYPDTNRIDQWPTWDLPILKWGKEQGGTVGFAHSGWGLSVSATSLPTFDVPQYDGIGANEYIVDVTHDAVDFISTVDTPAVWELNVWYHTLDCGFTTRISGETDFPCIYGERVGLGRSYVKLPKDKPLGYDDWVDGMREGRSYCSDGKTHLFDYEINGQGVGEPGDGGRASFLAVSSGQTLNVKTKAAALLAKKPREDIRNRPLDKKPYWHVERARVGDSRQVPVELIVNGNVVEQKLIQADGRVEDVEFQYVPERSSWICLRVFPAAHTNPIFVEVDGKPIRASRRSAQWCLESVDRCWKSKSPRYSEADRDAAAAAYEHAREVYRKIESESFDDGNLELPPTEDQ